MKRDNHLYKKPQNRYLRDKRMTLIIGFRCKDGVVLVSDTKITNIESGEPSYDSKILTPLEKAPFMVGAAGYSDLFREFLRKIPLMVNQRLSEFRIGNIEALLRTGLTRDEAIRYLEQIEQKTKTTQQSIEQTEKSLNSEIESIIAPIQVPYIYSYEHFMDDCKRLIGEISDQRKEESPYPLDVLIGVRKGITEPFPTLHYIDCNGNEHEVENYYAIGSGSPHVKQFFDRLYSHDKDMNELITLAFLTITYVQDIAKDPYVGYDSEHPPEAVAIFNDGRYGRVPFENETKVLSDIKNNIRQFEELIKNMKIEKLRSNVESPQEEIIRVPRLPSGTR